MKRAALIATAVLALIATAAFAVHASPWIPGWLVAVAFLALSVAAGGAAQRLHAPSDLREPRHPHGPSPEEPLPADVVSRAGVFGRFWWYAAGAFGVAALAPLIALARRPSRRFTFYEPGMRLVNAEGVPVRADDVAIDGVTTVFPEGRAQESQAATLLIRLQNDVVRAHPGRENWTPNGNVAYSKICTHAGCPVALYRQKSFQLFCPCHQSAFDVLDAARPVAGPATRALPQLGLDVDAHGYLIARGDFSDPVGPDEWQRTI